MKKIAFILLMAFSVTGMWAQNHTDTVTVFYRDPRYYYWDSNWVDHYIRLSIADGNPDIHWAYGEPTWCGYFATELARYFYTDTALRVIGLAAAINPYVEQNYYSGNFNYDPYQDAVEEYLSLYEIDSVTDEMILLGRKAWFDPKVQSFQNTRPRYIIDMGIAPHHGEWQPIYEVYFIRPITVHDSFYVSVTQNNDTPYDYYDPDELPAKVKFWTLNMYALEGWHNPTFAMEYSPSPSHVRVKNHYIDEPENAQPPSNPTCFTDTNWHCTKLSPCEFMDSGNFFFFIWPIIDTTTYVPYIGPCHVPSNFRAMYTTPEVSLFSWSAVNGADHYELAIGDPSLPPEMGTILECHDTYKPVNDLDTGCHYAAWVRTVCDSSRVSAWSDSVHFCVKSGGVGISTVADTYTQLYPNPTGGEITVVSSFLIGEVEVYSLTGQRVLYQRVDAISASLDLGSLPAGTYVVRIATNHGTAVKRLVMR